MGVGGQRHVPAALHPWERTSGTHYTLGWVGPRAGLDTEVRGKIFCPCRGSNPDRPGRPARSQDTILTKLHRSTPAPDHMSPCLTSLQTYTWPYVSLSDFTADLQMTTLEPTCLRPFKPGPRSRLALSQRYLVPFQTRHQPSRLGIMPQTNNKGCVGWLYLTGKYDRQYLRGTFHTSSPDIMLNSLRPHCSSTEMQIHKLSTQQLPNIKILILVF
jgi:hypothetical protein